MPDMVRQLRDYAAPEYEHYSETANVYDTTRRPVGVEVMLGCFATSSRPLQAQTILDGGCGTGNYVAAMHAHIGTIHGLDLNRAMLCQAHHKLSRVTSVHFLQGSLESLPYRDAMFDGMMCNQVVHHLTTGVGPEPFRGLRRLLGEAYRVLRSKGVLVFNTSSHAQVRDGFWWADLIPDAVHRMLQRFPTLADLGRMLQEAGFTCEESVVLADEVLQGSRYLDPYGPFSKAYRDGDSTWSLTTAAQLQRALARLQAMHNAGSMTRYVQQRDALRRQIGQTTCVIARK